MDGNSLTLSAGGNAGGGVEVRMLEGEPMSSPETEELLTHLELGSANLSAEERQSLESLLVSYRNIFDLTSEELGATQLVTNLIDTGDHRPIKQQVCWTPFALRAKVDQLVHEMLDQQVIEPSESPWASPIVLVQKWDEGIRFCVDYGKLSQVTKLDEFPLLRIDDMLDRLAGAQYFFTLDFACGYWRVEMEQSSKEKTAFTTYYGLNQLRKMPFSLVNAPAPF